MSRQDQYNVTVTVSYAGQARDLGTFDGMSGGEIDSDDTKFYPGGMQAQLSLGGRRSVNNVTVNRLYDLSRDHPNMGWLAGGIGKADVTITKTSLTVDGVATGRPLIYRGKLKQLTPPEHDSNSSDAATYELEISSATVTQ
jgi:hypothetical protein